MFHLTHASLCSQCVEPELKLAGYDRDARRWCSGIEIAVQLTKSNRRRVVEDDGEAVCDCRCRVQGVVC